MYGTSSTSCDKHLTVLNEKNTMTQSKFFGLFAISRATPVAYGGSQARGLIGAVAAGLHQSHSNVGSEPHLQPTPQLTATPDP